AGNGQERAAVDADVAIGDWRGGRRLGAGGTHANPECGEPEARTNGHGTAPGGGAVYRTRGRGLFGPATFGCLGLAEGNGALRVRGACMAPPREARSLCPKKKNSLACFRPQAST